MKAKYDGYLDEFDCTGCDDAKNREKSDDDGDLLKLFLRDIGPCERLSAAEARELARRCRETGDSEAAHRLGEAHQPLVFKMAKKYRKHWERNFMELVGAGNVGLMEAVRKFDPENDAPFAHYAAYWIDALIKKFLMDNHSQVKIGSTKAQRKLYWNMNKRKNALEVRGLAADSKALAESLDVQVREVVEMSGRMGGPDLSLDAPRSGDGKAWEDFLPADGPSVEDKVAELQLKARLRDMIDALRDKLDDRQLVILHKLLYTDSPMTLDKLGEELGVSRERVRQLEAGLVNTLRGKITNDLPDLLDFLDDGASAPARRAVCA